jgi:hypothetical protein
LISERFHAQFGLPTAGSGPNVGPVGFDRHAACRGEFFLVDTFYRVSAFL